MVQPSSPRSSRAQLEQVVDERAERAHVRPHAGGVLATRLRVDELVVDRVGQQAQRGDGRPQVVGDRGDEVAPRLLLGVQPRHHHIDVGRQTGDLVAPADLGADIAAPVPDGGERRPHGAQVGERAAADEPRRPGRERARVGHDQRGHQRVVAGHVHEPREQGDGDHDLRRADRRDQRELAPQPAEPCPPRDEGARDEDRHAAQRSEDRQGQRPGPGPVAGERHGRGGDGQAERQTQAARGAPRARGAHGANR